MAADASEKTPLAAASAPLRSDLWYLRTPLRRWLSLVGMAVGVSFAQGPLMSFQILEPAMLGAGGSGVAAAAGLRRALGSIWREPWS